MNSPFGAVGNWSRGVSALTTLALCLVLLGACDIDPVVSIPPFATLIVTTTTTGPAPDPDGYRVVVAGPSLNLSRAIGANASTVFSAASAGDYTFELTDVAGNCSVADNPRVVAAALGNVSTIAFEIVCT